MLLLVGVANSGSYSDRQRCVYTDTAAFGLVNTVPGLSHVSLLTILCLLLLSYRKDTGQNTALGFKLMSGQLYCKQTTVSNWMCRWMYT